MFPCRLNKFFREYIGIGQAWGCFEFALTNIAFAIITYLQCLFSSYILYYHICIWDCIWEIVSCNAIWIWDSTVLTAGKWGDFITSYLRYFDIPSARMFKIIGKIGKKLRCESFTYKMDLALVWQDWDLCLWEVGWVWQTQIFAHTLHHFYPKDCLELSSNQIHMKLIPQVQKFPNQSVPNKYLWEVWLITNIETVPNLVLGKTYWRNTIFFPLFFDCNQSLKKRNIHP